MKSIYLLAQRVGITTAEGFSTVLITLIILTPYCGFMFDCGCSWPWDGLESNCNVHDPLAEHHCPWCASLVSGVLSSAVSVLAALFVSTKLSKSLNGLKASCPPIYFLFVLAAGIIAFLVVATATGWVAGTVQDYPVFMKF